MYDNLAFEAMLFAREVHKNQTRKYTGNPYFDHLAEVAGIIASAYSDSANFDLVVATAWLHDCVEDQNVSFATINEKFGEIVCEGVVGLSDLEEGNRATRKALSRERLSKQAYWIQDIKVADMISNTSSIVKHDAKFAKIYLEEKRLLLDVLTKADIRLVEIARNQIKGVS